MTCNLRAPHSRNGSRRTGDAASTSTAGSNGKSAARRGTIAVRSIGTQSPSEGPEPDRIAGYRVEDARRQLESVCDRMLLRYVHVFRVWGGGSAEDVASVVGMRGREIGPAPDGGGDCQGSVRTTRDAMTSLSAARADGSTLTGRATC